jgi:hypothetical protein
LPPADHRAITEDECAKVGLPERFCRQNGQVAHDVDAFEWEDMAAHAQTLLGQEMCDAANRSIDRVTSLGRELVAASTSEKTDAPSAAALAIGRALHTIQDECAHKGMTNAHHAWFSVMEECETEGASRDEKPEAVACARERTERVFAIAAPILAVFSPDALADVCPREESSSLLECDRGHFPPVADVCEFLASKSDWDGIDRTWRSELVGDHLIKAFERGVIGDEAQSLPELCANDADIASTSPEPPVDVSGGLEACTKLDILCLGGIDKGDGGGGPAPRDEGGCRITVHQDGGVALFLLALALGTLLRSRPHRPGRRARVR